MPGKIRSYLLTGFLVFVVCTVFFIHIDAFEKFYALSRAHESWELDEFIAAVPGFLLGLLIYSLAISGRLFREVRQKRVSESHLKAVTERLKTILAATPVVVYACEPGGDYKISFISENVKEMSGFSAYEFLGKSIRELDRFHPDDASSIFKELDAVLRDGERSHEYRFRGVEGDYLWRQNTARLIRNEKGAPVEIVGCVVDITKVKQAEREVHLANERFMAVLDGLGAYIYVADMETFEILYVNRMLKEQFKDGALGGLCYETFQGRSQPCSFCTNSELVGPDGHPAGAAAWEFKHPENQRWFDIRDRAIPWVDGRLVRLEIAYDVTEAKDRSRRLREATFALDAATVGVAMAHLDGRIFYCNSELLRLWDMEDAEAVGKRLWSLWVDSEEMRRLFLSEDAPEKFKTETVALRSDGGVFDAYLEAYLVRGDQEEPLCLTVFVMDVSARKRHETELASLLDELRRSNEDLQQFAYAASHDLQEPLRIIAGFSQLLSRRYAGKIDKEADEFIHFIVDGAERMQALIEDLLEYSRVHTRAGAMEPVDLNEVLKYSMDNLKMSIDESGAAIHSGELPTVTADGRQLAQLFQNLLHNAIKFKSEASPEITVSSRLQDTGWLVEVRDNGLGVHPEYADRIFEVFKRLHSRGEYPGTGVGLAICKRIVERHKGRIWVEPAPGGGSSFCFTLPASAG
jgi:PAS domain S-box-containing protein